MTITDFLLDRIAEREAVASAEVQRLRGVVRRGGKSSALREARECEAMRRIVELYREHDHGAEADHRWTGFEGGYATATDHALCALAAIWSDHPDFDPAWRVDDTARA